jgi:ferrous iron transport protein B
VLPELTVVNAIRTVLIDHHWTLETAACITIFTLAHWPCSTTIITIFKETHSFKWTLLGVLLPTGVGVIACMIIHGLFLLF